MKTAVSIGPWEPNLLNNGKASPYDNEWKANEVFNYTTEDANPICNHLKKHSDINAIAADGQFSISQMAPVEIKEKPAKTVTTTLVKNNQMVVLLPSRMTKTKTSACIFTNNRGPERKSANSESRPKSNYEQFFKLDDEENLSGQAANYRSKKLELMKNLKSGSRQGRLTSQSSINLPLTTSYRLPKQVQSMDGNTKSDMEVIVKPNKLPSRPSSALAEESPREEAGSVNKETTSEIEQIRNQFKEEYLMMILDGELSRPNPNRIIKTAMCPRKPSNSNSVNNVFGSSIKSSQSKLNQTSNYSQQLQEKVKYFAGTTILMSNPSMPTPKPQLDIVNSSPHPTPPAQTYQGKSPQTSTPSTSTSSASVNANSSSSKHSAFKQNITQNLASYSSNYNRILSKYMGKYSDDEDVLDGKEKAELEKLAPKAVSLPVQHGSTPTSTASSGSTPASMFLVNSVPRTLHTSSNSSSMMSREATRIGINTNPAGNQASSLSRSFVTNGGGLLASKSFSYMTPFSIENTQSSSSATSGNAPVKQIYNPSISINGKSLTTLGMNGGTYNVNSSVTSAVPLIKSSNSLNLSNGKFNYSRYRKNPMGEFRELQVRLNGMNKISNLRSTYT